MNKSIYDHRGVQVRVGTKVKLLSLPEWLLSKVPEDEKIRLKSMIGQNFRVYEIDKWGGAWVEKWFDDNIDEGKMDAHDVSLDSHEMEVVD